MRGWGGGGLRQDYELEAILSYIENSRAIDFTVGIKFFFCSVPIHVLRNKSFFFFFLNFCLLASSKEACPAIA